MLSKRISSSGAEKKHFKKQASIENIDLSALDFGSIIAHFSWSDVYRPTFSTVSVKRRSDGIPTPGPLFPQQATSCLSLRAAVEAPGEGYVLGISPISFSLT